MIFHSSSNFNNKGDIPLIGHNVSSTVKNCYIIGNLSDNIVSGENNVGGLIGYNSGIVENCGAISSVSGTSNVGGLMGEASSRSSVLNCYAKGRIIGNGDSIGGLIGYSCYTRILDCNTASSVSGEGEKIGGLLGYSFGDTVTNCYASGNVKTEAKDVGGLIGSNSSMLSYCNAGGDVSGVTNVGGLCGYSNHNVVDCYATGDVSGTNYVGGLIGCNAYGMTTTSYATGDVRATENNVGGIVGYLGEGELHHCYSKGNVSGNCYVGGGIGYFIRATVKSCFSTGMVSGQETSIQLVGGFIGFRCPNCVTVCENCYYDQSNTAQRDIYKGTPLPTSEMQNLSVVDSLNNLQTTPSWQYVLGDYPHLSWEKRYSCMVTNGTISKNSAFPGETITITARAPRVDEIFEWTGDSVHLLQDTRAWETYFTMPPNSISFAPKYTQTYPLNINDGISGVAYFPEGAEVNVTFRGAEPAHYTFIGWATDTGLYEIHKNFTLMMPPHPLTLTPQYEQFEYQLIFNNGDGQKSEYKTMGTYIELRAILKPHFLFQHWADNKGNILSQNTLYAFYMPKSDTSAIAVYTQTEFELIVDDGMQKITSWHAKDSTVQISAAHMDCNQFVNWTDQNNRIVSTDSVYAFKMPAQRYALKANFTTCINLWAKSSIEHIELNWKGTDKRYEVWRTDITGKSKTGFKKIGSTKGTSFVDREPGLRFGKHYQYYIKGIPSKLQSTPLSAMLLERPFIDTFVACGKLFVLNADSVAVVDPIQTFGKPSTLAYYDDPAKPGKVKKISLAIDKTTFKTSQLKLFSKTEISMFNTKNFNKRKLLAHEYLNSLSFEKGQLDSVPLRVNIKKATTAKEHKKELRTFLTLHHSHPRIDSVFTTDTHVLFTDTGLTVSLAEADYDLTFKGQYFGMKKPKVWVEYIDANGKIKKQTLKVKPIDKAVKYPLTKSSITDNAGNSSCYVTIPAKKWSKDNGKDKLPEYKSLVISTGKAMDAIPIIIKK